MRLARQILWTLLAVNKSCGKYFLVSTRDEVDKKYDESTEEEDIILNNSDSNINGSDYNAAVALDKVVTEGSSVNLKCPSPVPFIDCQFKAPDGKVHKIGVSGNKYKSGNVESLGQIARLGPTKVCGVFLKNVDHRSAGDWSCHLKYKAGTQVAKTRLKLTTDKGRPIKKNSLITTLSRLDKNFIVSFNLWINKHIDKPHYRSALHLTAGTDSSRVPAVFLTKLKEAHIASSVNNQHNYWKNSPAGGLREGRWIPITISQQEVNKKHIYKINVDNKEIHRVENKHPYNFKNVKVYAGNPWFEPTDGRIESLTVESRGWCVDSKNKDQNTGQKGLAGGLSKEQCWSKCRDLPKVRGCEYHFPTKSCASHFNDVAGGSGQPGAAPYTCLLLLDAV